MKIHNRAGFPGIAGTDPSTLSPAHGAVATDVTHAINLVSQIADKVSTRHYNQTVEAEKPLRIAEGQNGLDIVRFDGIDDSVRTDASYRPNGSTDDGTTIFAGRIISVVEGTRVYSGFESGAEGHHLYMAGGKWRIIHPNATGLVIDTTAPHVWAVVNEPGVSARLYIDGLQLHSEAAKVEDHNIGVIGARFTGTSNYGNFDFYERWDWGSVLSDEDLLNTSNFLRDKWGM